MLMIDHQHPMLSFSSGLFLLCLRCMGIGLFFAKYAKQLV